MSDRKPARPVFNSARRAVLCAAVATLLCSFATAQTVQRVKLPATAAAKRLGEFLAAVESGDKAQLQALVEKSYSKQMRERRSLDEHFKILGSMHDNLGGFEVVKIESTSASQIVVKTAAKANGMTFYIDLTVEEAAPRGIARLAVDTNPPGSAPKQPGKAVKQG